MQASKIHIQNLNITLPTPTASPIAAILAHAALSDLDKKPDAPAPGRFELACNGGAVIDHKTGIMWERAGSDTNMVHDDAVKVAREIRIGGHDDWRLPEIDELLSIVDYGRSRPAINTDFFDCANAFYWSNTNYVSSSDCAWVVYFYNGSSSSSNRNAKCRVRACRASQ